MSKQVVATAGHVDHGKSTLVRALTGIEPDRLAEETRRGLTIDLGFAWTVLPSGQDVCFVDVPGHERFLGNMLAGLGPAPIVCFVVAADEGWSAQSSDHRDAIAALGIDQGVLVITRADLAPGRVDEVIAQARTELAGTGLSEVPAIGVSALTGSGLEDLRRMLDDAARTARVPSAQQRVRWWVDRSFTVAGAGTVVTGTLAAGTLAREDRLELCGAERGGAVTVRGLQNHGGPVERIEPVSRAALNLRGLAPEEIGRGDALLTPGAWEITDVVDVRRVTGAGFAEGPTELMVHVGTAAVPARVRPFGEDHARLSFARGLPLSVGDRMVLRSGGSRRLRTGAHVLDVDPPRLERRGDGTRRRERLRDLPASGDAAGEVARRGAMPAAALTRFGIPRPPDGLPGIHVHGEWLVDADAMAAWAEQLRETVQADHVSDALSAGLPRKAAVDALGLPDAGLLDPVVAAAGLRQAEGRIRDEETSAGLGAIEGAVHTLETRLAAAPFSAPTAEELSELGLGPRELAAAARHGRLLRLRGEVILLPPAPALAMRELAALPQPFTASQARQALLTSRRVAIPLLEHLDARGWTRRLDAGYREVVR